MSFIEKRSGATVVAKAEWALVGETSKDSLLVRGGNKPVSIRVSHGDSADLLQLISEANAGIAAHAPIAALMKE